MVMDCFFFIFFLSRSACDGVIKSSDVRIPARLDGCSGRGKRLPMFGEVGVAGKRRLMRHGTGLGNRVALFIGSAFTWGHELLCYRIP
jgi:hypothetical protein